MIHITDSTTSETTQQLQKTTSPVPITLPSNPFDNTSTLKLVNTVKSSGIQSDIAANVSDPIVDFVVPMPTNSCPSSDLIQHDLLTSLDTSPLASSNTITTTNKEDSEKRKMSDSISTSSCRQDDIVLSTSLDTINNKSIHHTSTEINLNPSHHSSPIITQLVTPLLNSSPSIASNSTRPLLKSSSESNFTSHLVPCSLPSSSDTFQQNNKDTTTSYNPSEHALYDSAEQCYDSLDNSSSSSSHDNKLISNTSSNMLIHEIHSSPCTSLVPYTPLTSCQSNLQSLHQPQLHTTQDEVHSDSSESKFCKQFSQHEYDDVYYKNQFTHSAIITGIINGDFDDSDLDQGL